MKRLPDWRDRLIAYLAASARTPFAEGRHDCALFAAAAILAMTGEDPAQDFRGRYSTTRGGLRVLRRAGFADHLAIADRYFDPMPCAFARPGDLAAVPGAEGPALGIVQGDRVYVLRREGLGTVSILKAVHAWRVPV